MITEVRKDGRVCLYVCVCEWLWVDECECESGCMLYYVAMCISGTRRCEELTQSIHGCAYIYTMTGGNCERIWKCDVIIRKCLLHWNSLHILLKSLLNWMKPWWGVFFKGLNQHYFIRNRSRYVTMTWERLKTSFARECTKLIWKISQNFV